MEDQTRSESDMRENCTEKLEGKETKEKARCAGFRTCRKRGAPRNRKAGPPQALVEHDKGTKALLDGGAVRIIPLLIFC